MKFSAEVKEAIVETISYRCPWINYAFDGGSASVLRMRSGILSASIEPAIVMIVAVEGDGWKKGKIISIPWLEIEEATDLLAANNEFLQIHMRRQEPTCKEINAIFELATNGIVRLNCHPLITK